MSVDVLVLSLGTTRGLVIADGQLAGMLEQAGASVSVAGVRIGAGNRLRRGYPLNDLVEATAARRALASALAREAPRAVIFSSTTASLLAGLPGVPYGIWLDSPARLNRPGRRNALLHTLERRMMSGAAVVMPLSTTAIESLPAEVHNAVVIPPPLDLGPDPDPEREPLVVAYTPDPKAKDLELVCRTWEAFLASERDPGGMAATPGARLVITGIEPGWAREFLRRPGLAELPAGCELAGMVSRSAFSGLLARAKVYLSAARWEDFGQAPLQALAAGAAIVAAPGGGPFPALALARELEPGFVAADRQPETLAGCLGAALAAADLVRYRSEARAALGEYTVERTVARLRDDVLPRLLA